MSTRGMIAIWLFTALAFTAPDAFGQAVGSADQARPVEGDPDISSMLVLKENDFRVLRDYAEPRATRRWHADTSATYQLFALVTDAIRLMIDGHEPIDILPGEVVSINGNASHSFTQISGLQQPR